MPLMPTPMQPHRGSLPNIGNGFDLSRTRIPYNGNLDNQIEALLRLHSGLPGKHNKRARQKINDKIAKLRQLQPGAGTPPHSPPGSPMAERGRFSVGGGTSLNLLADLPNAFTFGLNINVPECISR